MFPGPEALVITSLYEIHDLQDRFGVQHSAPSCNTFTVCAANSSSLESCRSIQGNITTCSASPCASSWLFSREGTEQNGPMT